MLNHNRMQRCTATPYIPHMENIIMTIIIILRERLRNFVHRPCAQYKAITVRIGAVAFIRFVVILSPEVYGESVGYILDCYRIMERKGNKRDYTMILCAVFTVTILPLGMQVDNLRIYLLNLSVVMKLGVFFKTQLEISLRFVYVHLYNACIPSTKWNGTDYILFFPIVFFPFLIPFRFNCTSFNINDYNKIIIAECNYVIMCTLVTIYGPSVST